MKAKHPCFHQVFSTTLLFTSRLADIARDQANQENVDLGDENDKDCDGIPDHLDNDMDNDGKIDRTQDSDMDGDLNHVDDDDDNDGKDSAAAATSSSQRVDDLIFLHVD